MGTEGLLRVRGLVAGYGRTPVLRGVDFRVDRGEVVALLGTNGSGKSTVLNTVSGFIRPWEGDIELEGHAIGGRPPHVTFREGIVQVSQGRDLFPEMSVEDNLKLGTAVRGDVVSQLAAVYALFPRLAERRQQRLRTMSGGEQQMVAVGRALMSEPKILLLDEPSGGLAPQFVNGVGEALLRLKQIGTTMVIVEQNIKLAFRVADRFMVLRDGRVSEEGRVSEVKAYEDVVGRIYL